VARRVLSLLRVDALVIYYQRSPRTRAAALAVAAALGVEEPPSSGRRRTSEGPIGVHRDVALERVEVVVIGTPACDGALPLSIEAFLRESARAARSLAFFCTAPGGGGAAALARMTALVRREPIAALALAGSDVHGQDFEAPIRRFVQEMERAFAPAAVA